MPSHSEDMNGIDLRPLVSELVHKELAELLRPPIGPRGKCLKKTVTIPEKLWRRLEAISEDRQMSSHVTEAIRLYLELLDKLEARKRG